MRLRASAAFVTALAACGGAARPQPIAPATTPAPAVAAAPAPAPAPAPVRALMSPAATATKVRELAGITEYRLSNGLEVLLFPDPSQSTVTVNITYQVGSRLEGYGETGMAHLLEHMTFKGTPRHRNIFKLVDERGGSANGITWTDRTNYFETLAADAGNLDWALDLEADRMVNCPIAADDLATEFSVVRNEFEQGENDPGGVLVSRMMSTAYLWHNYGKDTIGSRSDIERVSADRLRAFYRTYYQPDDAVLVVAGKFDTQAALASVIKTVGAVPRPDRTLAPTYTVEPVQDGEREVTLRRSGKVHIVGVLYHTVGGASPDYAAAAAALDVLAREPSGLLYKKLVKTQLASSVEAYGYQFKEPSVAIVTAQVPDAKNVAAVRKILTDTVEGLGAQPIDAAAIDRWRNAEIKQADLRFASSERSAKELTDAIALGDWRMVFAWRDQVEKVTPADVTRVARAYFKASNRTFGEFVPTSDADRAPDTTTPDATQIAETTSAPEAIAGEAFESSIDNIEARTVRKKLAGGLQAAFLSKKTRGGRVVVRMRLHYGDVASLAGKAVIARFVSGMLSRGTAKHDLQGLRDLEDKLEANIFIYGDAPDVVVVIDTFKDRLPGALDLAAEELTSPSFPAGELDVIKRDRLAELAEEQDDPARRAWIELARRTRPWPKDDPRHQMTVEEELEATRKVTIGDVKAFWRDYLGAGHGEVAVVGDFDPAAVSAQLDNLLGGWQAKKPFARLEDKRFDLGGGLSTLDTPDKEMAQLVVEERVSLRDDDPDYAPWLMLGQVLGGTTGARIWMRLREREGLSYGAFGWTSADSLDPVGSITGEAIVAPQNLAKARASMLDEFSKMATGAVTDDELARAKDGWIKELDRNLASDDFLVGAFLGDLYLGRTLEWQRTLEARVRAVTTDDIARVAKKYLHPEKLIIVQAGDLKKAAPSPSK